MRKVFKKYRQRAENSVEESFIMLTLQKEINEYTLPNEVMEVKDIYRRTTGVSSGTGNDIEPSQAAYLNTYMLGAHRPGGLQMFDSYISI